MILYLRSCNHILKVSVPCSKGGLESAPQAEGNLGRCVLQLTAALTFQHKDARGKLWSCSAFDQNKVRAHRIPCRRSLWDSHVRKGEGWVIWFLSWSLWDSDFPWILPSNPTGMRITKVKRPELSGYSGGSRHAVISQGESMQQLLGGRMLKTLKVRTQESVCD